MIRKAFLFFLIFILCSYAYFRMEWIVVSIPKQCNNTDDFLKRIPFSHKKTLEGFFRDLFIHDLLGYLLLGDKPMIVSAGHASYDLSAPFNCITNPSPSIMSNIKGCYLFEKYLPALPLKNIFFYVEAYKNEARYLTIVNQKRIREYLDFYSDEFKKNSGVEVSTKNYLLIKKGNNEVLGTLLGYGHYNAHVYAERHKQFLNEGHFSKDSFIEAWAIDKTTLQEIEDKDRYHNFIITFLNDHLYDLHTSFLPGFMADHSNQETKSILKLYLQSRKKQLQIFNNHNFLKVTLDLLLAEAPQDTLIEKINSLKPVEDTK